MATLNGSTTNKFSFFIKPIPEIPKHTNPRPNSLKIPWISPNLRRNLVVCSVTEDKELAAVDQVRVFSKEKENESDEVREKGIGENVGNDEIERLISRGINAAIVLGFGSLAVTRLLTIDHDYWHGWTLYEILRYAPEHNWIAYEEALKKNPVLAKMAISGVVYALGDWIAQNSHRLLGAIFCKGLVIGADSIGIHIGLLDPLASFCQL